MDIKNSPSPSTAQLEQRRSEKLKLRAERNRTPRNPEDFVCYESNDEEEETATQYLRPSFNDNNDADAREARGQIQECYSRRLLTNDLFKENLLTLNNMNKVFSSQWLSDEEIIFGTKCNKLMVYDIYAQKPVQIPTLHGRQPDLYVEPVSHEQGGIHSIEINPSRTLLSTGANNSNEIAIYRLPRLDPVCVGGSAHRDCIFDMCWLDDEFLVSGSRDNTMALWHISDKLVEASDETDEPGHRYIQPECIEECQLAEKVRALVFNKAYNEIAALSLNGYIHIWSAETFKQKISMKLPPCQENVCIAVKDDQSVYAVGSRSYTLLIDARTLQPIKKIPARYTGCGIRSISFQGSILTIGTALGSLMFYDVRAQKYLESSINSNRSVVLKTSRAPVYPDESFVDGFQNIKYTPAVYTHCYDSSGKKLFTAGGPIPAMLYGNYAGLWQ